MRIMLLWPLKLKYLLPSFGGTLNRICLPSIAPKQEIHEDEDENCLDNGYPATPLNNNNIRKQLKRKQHQLPRVLPQKKRLQVMKAALEELKQLNEKLNKEEEPENE
ncbi:hypothetical protein HHI36_004855 [Cryptolaemus montrouzieri]|uniref:Uncharacterized protein n=1 Tax=Cryptolaemus montrouzieri TaxID=559131 RepID=A0ABD2NT23_9CUCU